MLKKLCIKWELGKKKSKPQMGFFPSSHLMHNFFNKLFIFLCLGHINFKSYTVNLRINKGDVCTYVCR